MSRIVREGHQYATVIAHPAPLAGQLGNSPPNMTPIFNEIGTIAVTRISPKRLVRFGNNLRHVVAGTKGYNEKYWSLGTNRGY